MSCTTTSGAGSYRKRHKTASNRQRLDGLFRDGSWFCNCEHRLPALQLQVKKDSENRGRWFYTCQKGRDKQCGFFLWRDDAAVREKGAVIAQISGADTESNITIGRKSPPLPCLTPKTPSNLRQQPLFRGVTTPSTSTNRGLPRMLRNGRLSGSKASFATLDWEGPRESIPQEDENEEDLCVPPSPTLKRKRATELKLGLDDEDRDLLGGSSDAQQSFGSLASDDENQPAQLAARGTRSSVLFRFTQSSQSKHAQTKAVHSVSDEAQTMAKTMSLSGKESQKVQGHSAVTPSAARMCNTTTGLRTPLSCHIHLPLWEQPAVKRKKGADGAATPAPLPMQMPSRTASANVQATLTPFRTVAGGVDVGADTGAGSEDYEVTEAVLGLLEGQAVDKSTHMALRSYLNRHALRMRGIKRGRDMVRSAIKAKDVRIAELQERVTRLENERKAMKAKMKQLGSNFQALSQEDCHD